MTLTWLDHSVDERVMSRVYQGLMGKSWARMRTRVLVPPIRCSFHQLILLTLLGSHLADFCVWQEHCRPVKRKGIWVNFVCKASYITT